MKNETRVLVPTVSKSQVSSENTKYICSCSNSDSLPNQYSNLAKLMLCKNGDHGGNENFAIDGH